MFTDSRFLSILDTLKAASLNLKGLPPEAWPKSYAECGDGNPLYEIIVTIMMAMGDSMRFQRLTDMRAASLVDLSVYKAAAERRSP